MVHERAQLQREAKQLTLQPIFCHKCGNPVVFDKNHIAPSGRKIPLDHPYKEDEEFDSIHDAYYTCFMRKDCPKDYTEYIGALIGYWKVKGKDNQFIGNELQVLKEQGIKFCTNIQPND